MSRFDRLAANCRQRCLARPLTRANTLVVPGFHLENGIAIGLSVNK